jgi:threonine dehydratase
MDSKEVERAAKRLRDIVHNIPVGESQTFSKMSGAELYLKYENQQKTGSFKVRGAYNKLACLIERGEKPDAVVASSAGNHAQGVAYAASCLGIRAKIVMPRSAPIAKITATEGYGAEVILHGDCYDDSYQHAVKIAGEENAVFIHGFDDMDVIAGQGTVGLEILKDIPVVDIVIAAAGGGGLLAGIACCVKEVNPRVQVIGVQAEGADAIVRCYRTRELKASEQVRTIADGIAIKSPGIITTGLINQYVDDMITVTDEEIASAILLLIERTKQVVEPAGAVSVAAAVGGKLDIAGKKAVCVLSGGNIDVSFIQRIVEKGLVNRGRQIKLRTIMSDTPGSLEKFARITGQCGSNILSITHDRVRPGLHLGEAELHADCEVSGFEHGEQLLAELRKAGYIVEAE